MTHASIKETDFNWMDTPYVDEDMEKVRQVAIEHRDKTGKTVLFALIGFAAELNKIHGPEFNQLMGKWFPSLKEDFLLRRLRGVKLKNRSRINS